jgi:acyl dehydratase
MSAFQKGSALPVLVKPAITREQLKFYAEASMDPNPIHLDDETAKKVGLPSVIAHGMLTMAFMGEFLHQTLAALGWKTGKIQQMSTRFKAMTFPGDVITVTGTVKEASADRLVCDLETRNQKGEVTTTGSAVLSL